MNYDGQKNVVKYKGVAVDDQENDTALPFLTG
jgi:hypothetical protein